MAGNVWEWTGSQHRSYPYQPEDGRNLPDGEGLRVLRGGSFWDDAQNVRCAFRFRFYPDLRFDDFGFRVVSPGF